MKNKFLLSFLFLFLSGLFLFPETTFAHQPRIIYSQEGDINIINPELSQAFYDDLKGKPRDYFIDSAKDFELYINLLVPEIENGKGRYSAKVFLIGNTPEQQIAELDGSQAEWTTMYEEFGRDYYLKGPELTQKVLAGKYKIEVYSADNLGKYVLAVGKVESFDLNSILSVYWQIPLLKIEFFKTSVLQFFLTPFGIGAVGAIGALLIFLALINYIIGLIKEAIKHNQAKTLLLTSAGMQMKKEIIKLLQKPAYDITVAFISTAAKQTENIDFLTNDWRIMRDEMGFNVQEVDIDGKKEAEVMEMLKLKDIIFVEGGNAFYLLKAMRKCNFEKIIRKLLKQGKVYIGSSAGSMVAGRTIKTAEWKHPVEHYGVNDLRGLNLVPFDIFCHYQPEHAEIIKQKIKNPRKRAKKLKILTDEQAILVQGKEVALIGEGEAVII